MKPPCELVVKEILPFLRSAIVKELSESYNMKQTDIANALGITQASVSQYLNVERAKETKFSLEEFSEPVRKIAEAVASKKTSRTAVLHSLCELCAEARRSEEFCQIHQHMLNIEECEICKQ
jgi:predicted transcriptional regulator